MQTEACADMPSIRGALRKWAGTPQTTDVAVQESACGEGGNVAEMALSVLGYLETVWAHVPAIATTTASRPMLYEKLYTLRVWPEAEFCISASSLDLQHSVVCPCADRHAAPYH